MALEFDEAAYLEMYPDVAAAVTAGHIQSGLQHYEMFGRSEGRMPRRLEPCSICGGAHFAAHKILPPTLIADWELSPDEVDYIDRQQGTVCMTCGANLRIMVLGQAIQDVLQTDLPLRVYTSAANRTVKLLDINGCDALSAALAPLPGYLRANYPEVDICAMPFPGHSFDIVIHSDTLEHVPDPLQGLKECCRVLKPDGRLCFTVPAVVGRMSRNRAGLPKSYHGDPQALAEDFVVHTEFGADMWTLPMRAGFHNVAVKQIDHPSAHAVTAWRNAAPQPVDPTAKAYDQDGLRSIHNHDFMSDPAFVAAYQRGVRAVGYDYNWHWRVHVGLWAANTASKLQGDFVECGTNRGFLTSAIMHYLNWDKTGRCFYLLDTFSGLDERFVSSEEKRDRILERNQRELESGFYITDVEPVRANFAEWNNVSIIVGAIPETLAQIDTQEIAFLHIDLNCSPPEVAALRYLWDRLLPGAPVLLDDYAYYGFEWQKLGMDTLAGELGVSILSLPTGQGLLIKPR